MNINRQYLNYIYYTKNRDKYEMGILQTDNIDLYNILGKLYIGHIDDKYLPMERKLMIIILEEYLKDNK